MLVPLSRRFLEDKNRLEAWRKETGGRRRIPDELWKAAVCHVKEQGLNCVSREFRLSYSKLKEKTLRLGGSFPEGKPARSSHPQLIELALPAGPVESSPKFRLVFERADGHRLMMEGSQLELAFTESLMRSFYSR
jgi:hypothetical protein